MGSTFRIGIHDGDGQAAMSTGLTAHDTSLAIGGDTHRSGLQYSIGNPTSRNYTGGYYSQDNLRSMLTDAINKATTSAADASVSYDHSTRTYTLTTGSRSNQSSLSIGKSVATNITLDNSASATSLVDSTPGTSGFVGALGLSENSSSTGSGSFFEFRLGGAGDTFSINFGTFGVTNMGADQRTKKKVKRRTIRKKRKAKRKTKERTKKKKQSIKKKTKNINQRLR